MNLIYMVEGFLKNRHLACCISNGIILSLTLLKNQKDSP